MVVTNIPNNHGVCPHCGYCPHCGRSNHQFYPVYPQYPYITWDGSIAGSTTTNNKAPELKDYQKAFESFQGSINK